MQRRGGGVVSKKYFFRLVLRFKTPHPPFLVKYDVKKLGIVKVYYVYIIFIYTVPANKTGWSVSKIGK